MSTSIKSTSITPYLSAVPPTPHDMEIAIAALFGRPGSPRELTPEQKATQDEALRPYMGRQPTAPTESPRSIAAREARLKVLARKAAEREAAHQGNSAREGVRS